MKNRNSLLKLSALLSLVVLVSFCAINIISGDVAVALGPTSLAGYDDTSIESFSAAISSSSSGVGVSGFITETRDMETMMLGVQLVPLFENQIVNSSDNVRRIRVDEYVARKGDDAEPIGDRHLVESYPITTAIVDSITPAGDNVSDIDTKLSNLTKKAFEQNEIDSQWFKTIITYGTYGIKGREKAIGIFFGKEHEGGYKLENVMDEVFAGNTNFETVYSWATDRAEQLDLLAGLKYDPFMLTTNNIDNTFIIVPRMVTRQLYNFGTGTKGGITGLLAQANVRKGIQEKGASTVADNVQADYPANNGVSDAWLTNIGGRDGSDIAIKKQASEVKSALGKLSYLSDTNAQNTSASLGKVLKNSEYAGVSALETRQHKADEALGALFPIFVTIIRDNKGGYFYDSRGILYEQDTSKISSKWGSGDTLGSLKNMHGQSTATNTKFVASMNEVSNTEGMFSHKLSDGTVCDSAIMFIGYDFGNKTDNKYSFDCCIDDLSSLESEGGSDLEDASITAYIGRKAYEYYSNNLVEANYIVQNIFNTDKYFRNGLGGQDNPHEIARFCNIIFNRAHKDTNNDNSVEKAYLSAIKSLPLAFTDNGGAADITKFNGDLNAKINGKKVKNIIEDYMYNGEGSVGSSSADKSWMLYKIRQAQVQGAILAVAVDHGLAGYGEQEEVLNDYFYGFNIKFGEVCAYQASYTYNGEGNTTSKEAQAAHDIVANGNAANIMAMDGAATVMAPANLMLLMAEAANAAWKLELANADLLIADYYDYNREGQLEKDIRIDAGITRTVGNEGHAAVTQLTIGKEVIKAIGQLGSIKMTAKDDYGNRIEHTFGMDVRYSGKNGTDRINFGDLTKQYYFINLVSRAAKQAGGWVSRSDNTVLGSFLNVGLAQGGTVNFAISNTEYGRGGVKAYLMRPESTGAASTLSSLFNASGDTSDALSVGPFLITDRIGEVVKKNKGETNLSTDILGIYGAENIKKNYNKVKIIGFGSSNAKRTNYSNEKSVAREKNYSVIGNAFGLRAALSKQNFEKLDTLLENGGWTRRAETQADNSSQKLEEPMSSKNWNTIFASKLYSARNYSLDRDNDMPNTAIQLATGVGYLYSFAFDFKNATPSSNEVEVVGVFGFEDLSTNKDKYDIVHEIYEPAATDEVKPKAVLGLRFPVDSYYYNLIKDNSKDIEDIKNQLNRLAYSIVMPNKHNKEAKYSFWVYKNSGALKTDELEYIWDPSGAVYEEAHLSSFKTDKKSKILKQLKPTQFGALTANVATNKTAKTGRDYGNIIIGSIKDKNRSLFDDGNNEVYKFSGKSKFTNINVNAMKIGISTDTVDTDTAVDFHYILKTVLGNQCILEFTRDLLQAPETSLSAHDRAVWLAQEFIKKKDSAQNKNYFTSGNSIVSDIDIEELRKHLGQGTDDDHVDIILQTWEYDELFSGVFSSKSNGGANLMYDYYYGLGMEYSVLDDAERTIATVVDKNDRPDSKDKNNVTTSTILKLTNKDVEKLYSGATDDQKQLYNKYLVDSNGNMTGTVSVAGTGALTGIYRGAINTADAFDAKTLNIPFVMYQDNKGLWPGAYLGASSDKKKQYGNHMYFKVKSALALPVAENAEIVWIKNGTHEVEGINVGANVNEDAELRITASFKSGKAEEGKDSSGKEQTSNSAEFTKWKQSLASLGIDAVTIYVYHDSTSYASSCEAPCDKHDMCATNTVAKPGNTSGIGTFGQNAWTMTLDDFANAIYNKTSYKMPINMKSDAWREIAMVEAVNGIASSPNWCCSSGTRVDYSIKIKYLGIVNKDNNSKVKNAIGETAPRTGSKANKLYKSSLNNKDGCYDLLTGAKIVDAEVEARDLGYTEDGDKELNQCWLLARGATRAKEEIKIVKSHDDVSSITAYATIKDGGYENYTTVPTSQAYNVMNGVPSTEKVYFVTGGDEFIYEIATRYIKEEQAVRTYISSFNSRPCKFIEGDTATKGGAGTGYTTQHSKKLISHAYNNETVERTVNDTFVLPEPKNTGRRTNAVWQAPEHGGVTITATWKGTIRNETSDPGVVLIIPYQDNLGTATGGASITGSSSGNGKTLSWSVAPGNFYTGYAGEMKSDQGGNAQNLAGNAGGTYKWAVNNYNTDVRAAYEWAKAIEVGSQGDGNVIIHSDSDRAVRSWHAGDAEIAISFTNFNSPESAINEQHTKSYHGNWTNRVLSTDNVLKNAGEESGGLLKTNDMALTSGYFEHFGTLGSATGTSCLGTQSSGTTNNTEPSVWPWADQADLYKWRSEGHPEQVHYSYIDSYSPIHTAASGETSCGGWNPNPHVTEGTYPETFFRCCDNAIQQDASEPSHNVVSEEKDGPGKGGCPGHGKDEDGNDIPCDCTHTVYHCEVGESSPGKPADTHTCDASHTPYSGNNTTTVRAKDIGYTITVTFKNTFTMSNDAGTDATGAGKKSCNNGTYPKHALCGPCCSHTLPAITDNWVQYVKYNYVAIEDISVLKIGKSAVKGLNAITYDYDAPEYEYIKGDITHGDPNIWYNIADFNYAYHMVPVNGNKQQASAAGRLRYSLQAQQLDDVVWLEENNEGVGVKADYKWSRTGDCDGQSKTKLNENPVPVLDKGHVLSYAKGILYARTIDSFAIEAGNGANPYNNGTGKQLEGAAERYTLGANTVPLAGIIGNDMSAVIGVKGALYGGQVKTVTETIADSTDSFLSSPHTWYHYSNIDAHPEVYTSVDKWFDTIRAGGAKIDYSLSVVDDKDVQTLEYKRFKERRRTPVEITVCSDMLVLQTSTGDIPVVYGEAVSSAVAAEHSIVDTPINVSTNDAVGNHCGLVNLKDPQIDYIGRTKVGGYNGRGHIGGYMDSYDTEIFTKSGYVNFRCVLDTESGRDEDVSVKHPADKCDINASVMNPRMNFRAVDTATNLDDARYYKTSPVMHQKRLGLADYLKIGKNSMQLNPILTNGKYKMDVAEQTWIPIFKWTDGVDAPIIQARSGFRLPFDKQFPAKQNTVFNKQLFTLEAVYYSGATKVNDVIIHTPIANTYTYLEKYDGPIEDQRAGAGEPEVLESYCPGVAKLCDHNVLSCEYYRDTVRLSLNFEPTNYMQTRNSYNQLVYEEVNTTRPASDGSTIITNIAKQYSTGGAVLSKVGEIVGSAGYSKARLTAGTNNAATLRINLADIDCDLTTGTKLKISFDYRSDGGNNVVLRIGKFSLYFDGIDNNKLFMSDSENTRSFTLGGINGNERHLDIVYSPDGIEECTVAVGGTNATGVDVGTNNGKTLGDNVSATAIIFGDVENKRDSYVDNVVVTRLSGSATHTAACYQPVVTHETSVQFACQKPVAILAGTQGAQAFTAPVSGLYTIECYGAQGGGSNTTATSEGLGNVGGLGGYTKAQVYLEAGKTIYAYVGKKGSYANGAASAGGGWNGGGNGSGTGYGGGGMTYVSYSNTDTQVGKSVGTVETANITSFTNTSVLEVASGTSYKSLTPGIYYAEVHGDQRGASGIFALTNTTTVYYSVGSTSWLNVSNSATNSLLYSGSNGSSSTYNSNLVKVARTGYTVSSRRVAIKRLADLSGYSNIQNIDFTASQSTINPLSSPVTVLNVGAGYSSYTTLTPGIYYISASGRPGTGGNGGSASGWILVTGSKAYYFNTMNSAWINSTYSSTNANVYAGKGAVAYVPEQPAVPAIPAVNTFNYTGAMQSISLPAGTYVLEAYGAQGKDTSNGYYDSNNNNYGYGGLGGYARGVITLASPTTLYIGVGQAGQAFSTAFNGGGYGKDGGGGASHIATADGVLSSLDSNRGAILLVAGGGGGVGPAAGGAGGGANQNGGNGTQRCGRLGYGGTLSAGGSATYSAAPGTFGQGGSGGVSGANGAGGGGGGYYGGGGSRGDYEGFNDYDDSGAGGGSGYANLSALTGITGASGVQSGNGKVVITGDGTPAKPAVPAVPAQPAETCSTYGVKNGSIVYGNSASASAKIIRYVDLSGVSNIPSNLLDLMVTPSSTLVSYNSSSISSAKVTYRKTINVTETNVALDKMIAVAGGGGGAGSNASCAAGSYSDMSGGEGGVANTLGKVSGLRDASTSTASGNLIQTFGYTGAVQSITLDPGTYILEAGGASGGGSLAGEGGVTSGKVTLSQRTTLYVYVGGQGTYRTDGTNCAPATFNGGGDGGIYMSTKDGHQGGAGGGATDFRLTNGAWDNAASLQSRVLVAGGGGGSGCASSHNRGHGGGLVGVATLNTPGSYYHDASASGGSQITGGTAVGAYSGVDDTSNGKKTGGFGRGANAVQCGAGGGGGYYGGGSEYTAGGAGGSSYVSGYAGCDTTYRNSQRVGGEYLAFSDVELRQGGNIGNGYAKVYKVGGANSIGTFLKEFGYTGSAQSITLPAGTYLLETFGAQGGAYNSGYAGGYGGYTSGIVTFDTATTLYVYVGKQGDSYPTNYSTGVPYNGGGKGYGGGGDGGGSTDIRLIGGDWYNDTSLRSRILVAGGGGGSDLYSKGGHGGGYAGADGLYPQGRVAGTGGTQTHGGINTADRSVDGRFGYGGGHQFNAGSDSGGGGGGYYGGAAGWGGHDAGGGGSAYVSNFPGFDTTYLNSQKVNGKNINFCNVAIEQGVRMGDGVARIYAVTTQQMNGANSAIGGNAGGGGGGYYGGESHAVGMIMTAENINDSRGVSHIPGAAVIDGTSAHCCMPDTASIGRRYVKVTVYGNGLAGKLTGVSPCSSYGQQILYSDITNTRATFVIDKGSGHESNALSMGFNWAGTGAQIYRYTLEGSNTSSFSTSGANGGGNGGTSGVNYNNIERGSESYRSGVNYGDGLVVITLGRHSHDANCERTDNSLNHHTHKASCIAGDAKSKAALTSAIEDAKRNNNWDTLCNYLSVEDKADLTSISSNGTNVYSAITSGSFTSTTVDTVISILRAQTVDWWNAISVMDNMANPIFACSNIYDEHVCSSRCISVNRLVCTEPHHTDGHYNNGHEVCWEACHNDYNHIEYNGMRGVSGSQLADRLQLDDYFTLHWDNRGHFYDLDGENTYWTGSSLSEYKGQGYFNKHDSLGTLDTTRWIRAKLIKFDNVDVIFYNEHTGLWEFHAKEVPFYLPVVTDGVVGNGNDDVLQRQTAGGGARDEWRARQGDWSKTHAITEYKFYLLLDNHEYENTQYQVWTIGINDDISNDTKSTPYAIKEESVDCRNSESDNALRPAGSGKFASYTSCFNRQEFDVVGSIGNLLITSTTDFRFSNFFKQSTSEWEVEPFIRKVNDSVQNKYLGIGVRSGQMLDVRFRPVAKGSGYYNTWGTEPWAGTAEVYNLVGGDAYSILTADIRNNYATSDTELVMGYKFFTEITTIGDYYGIDVDESYYLLDKETGEIMNCDIWTKSSDGYKAAYITGANTAATGFINGNDMSGLIGDVNSLIRSSEFEENKQTISVAVEADARQVSRSEIERTQQLDSYDGNAGEDFALSGTISEVLEYIGNLDSLYLTRSNRTYIGSSFTNILSSTRYNTSGTFNGSLSTDVEGKIGEDRFARQARRWLFTLGLPETAYVVPFCSAYEGGKHLNPNIDMSDGRNPITGILYDAEGKGKERYVVLVGVDISARGEVWELDYEAYKQPQILRIDGRSYTLPNSMPDILAVMSLNTVPDTDWDIIKTH